jgi:hypothetical protein
VDHQEITHSTRYHSGQPWQAALASRTLAERYSRLVASVRAPLPPFPTPAEAAAAAEVDLRPSDHLSEEAPVVVNGSIVLVQRHRRRVQGWLAFLGIARVVLERAYGAHEESAAAWMAAELAAPSAALRGLSLRTAARCQPWVPAWVLARGRSGTVRNN